MSVPEQTQPAWRRTLGAFDATAVVVGAIIGVGIFFTPADVARLAGTEARALTAWALGGLVALLGAFTFAELGRRYPRAGGQYDVLREAWGRGAAFLYSFCVLTAILPGSVAVIARITTANLAVAVTGDALSPGAEMGLSLALVVAVIVANGAGVRFGAGIQNFTVVVKVAVLLALAGLAAVMPRAALPAALPSPAAEAGLPGLFVALIPALFSYGGWQQALWMGAEIKDAERTLPRAILSGVFVVVAVYLAAAWAFFSLLGFDAVATSHALAAEAVGRVWPGLADRAVAAAVAVSAFGVLNVQFLTGPRLTWAMAADGRFFAPFARLHAGTGTPLPAILLLGVLSVLVLAVGTDAVGQLTAWVVVLDALFFGLTGLALLRLGARTARWIVLAGGFALLELACVVFSFFDPAVQGSALAGALWLAAAAGVYLWRFRVGVSAGDR